MEICRGETKAIQLDLVDEDGAALDITGWTQVRVAIGKKVTAAAAIEASTDDSSSILTVTDNPASVSVRMTQEQSSGLAVGLYKVQVWVVLNEQQITSKEVALRVYEGLGEPS